MIIIIWKLIVLIGILIPIQQWKGFQKEVEFLNLFDAPPTKTAYWVPLAEKQDPQVVVKVSYPSHMVAGRSYDIVFDIENYTDKEELLFDLRLTPEDGVDPIIVAFGPKHSSRQISQIVIEPGSGVSTINFQPQARYQEETYKYERVHVIQVAEEADILESNRTKWKKLALFVVYLLIWLVLLIWT